MPDLIMSINIELAGYISIFMIGINIIVQWLVIVKVVPYSTCC